MTLQRSQHSSSAPNHVIPALAHNQKLSVDTAVAQAGIDPARVRDPTDPRAGSADRHVVDCALACRAAVRLSVRHEDHPTHPQARTAAARRVDSSHPAAAPAASDLCLDLCHDLCRAPCLCRGHAPDIPAPWAVRVRRTRAAACQSRVDRGRTAADPCGPCPCLDPCRVCRHDRRGTSLAAGATDVRSPAAGRGAVAAVTGAASRPADYHRSLAAGCCDAAMSAAAAAAVVTAAALRCL